MKYDCSACTGLSPCCWENPATTQQLIDRGFGHIYAVDPKTVRRWRLRWWPIWIKVTRTSIKVRWFVLARAHKGLHP